MKIDAIQQVLKNTFCGLGADTLILVPDQLLNIESRDFESVFCCYSEANQENYKKFRKIIAIDPFSFFDEFLCLIEAIEIGTQVIWIDRSWQYHSWFNYFSRRSSGRFGITDLKNFCDGCGLRFETWSALKPWCSKGPFSRAWNAFTNLPFIDRFAGYYWASAFKDVSLTDANSGSPSVSVIIPCRNESGNLPLICESISRFAINQEIIFVEGNSADDTWDQLQNLGEEIAGIPIRCVRQPDKGKGDAVFFAVHEARNDIVMILDADLTVPAKELERMYKVFLLRPRVRYVQGTRLVFCLEKGAMQLLNFFANRVFALVFRSLLKNSITDTLCGTKCFYKSDFLVYKNELDRRSFVDPFGDFTFLFGNYLLGNGVVEVPIKYKARTFGDTQISRFKHGFILLKFVFRILISK